MAATDGRPRREAELAETWREHAYNCFSSGHKFCREPCPVMQVTRNEAHTPTAFHANVVAMDKGLLELEEVADDYVHCTQCGGCEVRCPNSLMVGDFYRARTETTKVVRAVRAMIAGRSGRHRAVRCLICHVRPRVRLVARRRRCKTGSSPRKARRPGGTITRKASARRLVHAGIKPD